MRLKTSKKLISILLVLVMAVCLFTGCGKKTPKDTTLEGTWKLTEVIVTVNGVKDEESSMIYPEKDDEENPKITAQPYIKFEKNKAKLFAKFGIKGEKPYYLPDEINDGTVVFLGEYDYSVEGNKIIIINEDEEGNTFEETGNYVIDGNILTITSIITTEEGNEETTVQLVKVSNSEIAGAISADEINIR
jgi:hypothetical protein